MGYANAIRTHLTTGSAVAGASILALGLVIATPDDHGARNEVRAVQLAARTLPTAAERWDASLREFIRNRIEPVANEVSGGRSADAPAAVVNSSTARVTTPPRMVSSTGPAVNFQKADATTLAASTTALAIPSIFAPLEAVLGVLILFGPLIVLVVLACPPCAVINFLSYFLPIPTVPLVAAAQLLQQWKKARRSLQGSQVIRLSRPPKSRSPIPPHQQCQMTSEPASSAAH